MRLCYVAMTREKENLVLLAVKHYGDKALPESRYVQAAQDILQKNSRIMRITICVSLSGNRPRERYTKAFSVEKKRVSRI